MKCCRISKTQFTNLPFSRILYFDFYDGPLAGYTICSECKRCFHFSVLEWNTYTSCRVFGFSPLDIDFNRLENDYNNWIQQAKPVSSDKKTSVSQTEFSFSLQTDYVDRIETIASRLNFSYLCVTPGYLDRGYWRIMDERENSITDWIEHLGITHDEDNFSFQMNKW